MGGQEREHHSLQHVNLTSQMPSLCSFYRATPLHHACSATMTQSPRRIVSVQRIVDCRQQRSTVHSTRSHDPKFSPDRWQVFPT